MKILLAVDGSAYTKKMLAYVTTHMDMFAGPHDFTLLTVHHPLPARARSVVGKDAVDGFYAEECEKIINPVLKFLDKHGIDPKTVWKVGPAGETIAKFAESGKFDLVIMGSRGHGAFGSLVMGSVATKVMANCTTPVLLVR